MNQSGFSKESRPVPEAPRLPVFRAAKVSLMEFEQSGTGSRWT
jgi:hypothetical protein